MATSRTYRKRRFYFLSARVPRTLGLVPALVLLARDFFDHSNAAAVFMQMAKNEQLTPKMLERMKKGSNMPGWVKRAAFDWYQTITDREA